MNVLAMDRRIYGERQPKLRHPMGTVELLLRGSGIGADALGIVGIHILKRDLHVIEAALDELLKARAVQRHRGGDQIGVEAGLGSSRDDLLKVLAHRGLAAGQMHLQDAHGAGLLHYRHPFSRRKLLVHALKFERVRAVGALQRATMG